jgi:3-hydroxybutyryl-CoA dehydrogenase
MTIDKIKNVCAIGAGAMGAATALCFAMAGYPVRLYDLTEAAVASGVKNMHAALETFRQHGLVREADMSAIMARVTTTISLQDAADADFIIESIVENLAIKQKVFAELDKICPPHTIFATNTSGLSPTKIAEAILRKDKFVVTHFWNPPHLIPLVEVVPGEHTSKETVDSAVLLMNRIGKKPVALSRESLGFVGNRIQAAALREAIHIVAEGIASAEDVDAVVRYSLGRRYAATGPLESADLGGLDVFASIFSYLGPDLCSETKIPELLAQVTAQGKLGAKTGEGFYKWSEERLAALKQQRIEELFRYLEQDNRDSQASIDKVA